MDVPHCTSQKLANFISGPSCKLMSIAGNPKRCYALNAMSEATAFVEAMMRRISPAKNLASKTHHSQCHTLT